ncbi:TPA: hypothetical protein QCX51_005594 [Bacillus mycoides]|jgi:hypothetical protein|nr:hypothetical protein [Bacillus mycoides]NUC20395.1 hypothetical protein [Bacillus mycoides]HDR7568223.1 hypothetical protein [Bacillus mycoides]
MSKQLITTITSAGVNWRVEDRGIVLGRGKASGHKEARDTVNKRHGGYAGEEVRLSAKLYDELKERYKETGEAPKGFLDGNYTLEDE